MELIQGDCLEVMKSIESGSVDAIITDPPYGTTACKWDSVIDFDLMWEQLNRIIKPNGAIVLFGNEPFSSALRMSNIKNYKYDWIWNKSQGVNFAQSNYMPLKDTENILVFGEFGLSKNAKNKGTYNPQGLKDCHIVKNDKTFSEHRPNLQIRNFVRKKEGYPKQILKYGNDRGFHSTQKPILLMEYLIKTYTNENEIVLDFTMGSGSTMVACQNTNRKGIGIEQDSKYFKIAQDRIEANKFKLF